MSLSVKIWIVLGVVFMFLYGAMSWVASTAVHDAAQAFRAREKIERAAERAPPADDAQASSDAPSPDEQLAALKAIAARSSARAPYSVGDGLLFLGAEAAMEAGQPVYHSRYEMTRHTAKDFTPSKATLLKLAVMPRLLRKVCNSANVGKYLNAGSAMSFDYSGSDGKSLLKLRVDKSDCEGLSKPAAPGDAANDAGATTQNGAQNEDDDASSANSPPSGRQFPADQPEPSGASPRTLKPQTRANPEPGPPLRIRMSAWAI